MKNRFLLALIVITMNVTCAYSMKLEKEQETTGPCRQTKLLISAVTWNQLEKAKEILEHLRDFGKDIAQYVNQPDENGLTALHYAAACETDKFERGSVPMIELLLKAGALINAQDKNGQTPLHKNLEIFENKKTNKSMNDKLCCHYNKFVVQCLLENGANPNLANNKKITPLQLLEKIQPHTQEKNFFVLLILAKKYAQKFISTPLTN